MESSLTSKGQVTIPKEARDHLNLKPGDRVKFFIYPDGRVAILPVLPATALRGMLKSNKGRAVTLEEMDAGIEKGATRGFKRGKK